MKKEILIIGDAWNTLDHSRDSSLHLARVALAEFGLVSQWALPENVFLQNSSFYARIEGTVDGERLRPSGDTRELSSFQSVHWRADPPVTLATMRLWSLLAASGGEKGVPFVNAPQALLTWNEKFAPLRFRDWAIPGLASDSESVWKSYYEQATARGAQLIAKPVGDAASRGVQLLPPRWLEAARALRELHAAQGPWLLLQEYDRQLLELGETRVFVLDRQIAGAINKVPHPKHPIMNLDAPTAERPELRVATLTPEQERRAREVAKTLAAEGVYLATIDFIGERILEINVTSPGLIGWLDERLPRAQQLGLRYWRGILAL